MLFDLPLEQLKTYLPPREEPADEGDARDAGQAGHPAPLVVEDEAGEDNGRAPDVGREVEGVRLEGLAVVLAGGPLEDVLLVEDAQLVVGRQRLGEPSVE